MSDGKVWRSRAMTPLQVGFLHVVIHQMPLTRLMLLVYEAHPLYHVCELWGDRHSISFLATPSVDAAS